MVFLYRTKRHRTLSEHPPAEMGAPFKDHKTQEVIDVYRDTPLSPHAQFIWVYLGQERYKRTGSTPMPLTQ